MKATGMQLHPSNIAGIMMAMRTVTEQLRDTIKASGQTLTAIADGIGANKSVLSRFASGAELSSGTLDRLAGYFGLTLKPIGRAKSGKGAKPGKGR